jgi:hypothetical protein
MGNLSDVLGKLVKQLEADLVVMGTQGMSMAERILIGSDTANVLEIGGYLSGDGSAYNASFTPIQHILFACQCDFLSGHNMFPKLKEITQAYNAEVEILRIEEPSQEPANIQER